MQADEQATDAPQLTYFDTQLIPCDNHETTPVAGMPYSREFHVGELISSTAPGSDPTSTAVPYGHPVTRSPEQLRLHPALDALGWNGLIGEFNDALQFRNQFVPPPILITSDGTILAGFGRWRLAAIEGNRQLHCIEYQLSEEESLRFILGNNRPRQGWNAFLRIRLALTLETHFQQKALANMRAGGTFKGSANLPEAQRIDARREIARVAGVGACGRNISKVKKILQTAHRKLICALQDGTLSINRALDLCELPKDQQLEAFIQYSEERAIRKLIHQTLGRLKKKPNLPDAASALEALQTMEAAQPGLIVIRSARRARTVILVGKDLLASPHAHGKLKLR